VRKNSTILVTVASLLTLNGCILPPVVTLASYSVDIVTYEATGKTATDHVYSAVARSDCSFVRVLHEQPICVDPPAATDTTTAQTTVPASAPQTPDAATSAPSTAIASAPATPSPAKVTIGSFRDQGNAERAVAHYSDWHPVITNVTVGGQVFHRVTAHPLTSDAAAALKAKLAAEQPARLRVAQN
jgi:SPOR domain